MTNARIPPPAEALPVEESKAPTGINGAVGRRPNPSHTKASIPPEDDGVAEEEYALEELREFARDAIRRGAKVDEVAVEFKRLSGVKFDGA